MNNCSVCGNPQPDGKAIYCFKCGSKLLTQTTIMDDIKAIDQEPLPYDALRFTGGLIVFLGWVVIIVGTLAITMASAYTLGMAEKVIGSTSAYSVTLNVSRLITIIGILINAIIGISFIAAGQVIAVLLDIRNDLHTTKRYIRRFGLHGARKDF